MSGFHDSMSGFRSSMITFRGAMSAFRSSMSAQPGSMIIQPLPSPFLHSTNPIHSNKSRYKRRLPFFLAN